MEFDMLTSPREDILRQKRRHFHLCYDSSSCVLLCTLQSRVRPVTCNVWSTFLKAEFRKHVSISFSLQSEAKFFQSMPMYMCLHPKVLEFEFQSFFSENLSWSPLAVAGFNVVLCPPARTETEPLPRKTDIIVGELATAVLSTAEPLGTWKGVPDLMLQFRSSPDQTWACLLLWKENTSFYLACHIIATI